MDFFESGDYPGVLGPQTLLLRPAIVRLFDCAAQGNLEHYSFAEQEPKVWKALGLNDAQLRSLSLQGRPDKPGLADKLLDIAENAQEIPHLRRAAIHLWGNVMAHNGLTADQPHIDRLRVLRDAADGDADVRETASRTICEFNCRDRYAFNRINSQDLIL